MGSNPGYLLKSFLLYIHVTKVFDLSEYHMHKCMCGVGGGGDGGDGGGGGGG